MFLTLLVAATVSATDVPQATRTLSTGSSRRICRSEARTGTRFETRTCHTKAEWDSIAEIAQRDSHEFIDSPKPNQTSEH